MIETMVKAAELAENKLEQTAKKDIFDPDKRIDSGSNALDKAGSEEYDPDKRVGQEVSSEIPQKSYYDDNGELYRIKDALLPNNSYEINGYKYATDEKGRIVSAEGKLHLREDDYERNMEDVRNKEGQDYKSGDERGHVIGHQFGGSDRLENLVPMDAKLNHGDFFSLEKKLADAVWEKADVRLKVEPVYKDDSTRPSEFRVSYSIDGDRQTTVFRNEREG